MKHRMHRFIRACVSSRWRWCGNRAITRDALDRALAGVHVITGVFLVSRNLIIFSQNLLDFDFAKSPDVVTKRFIVMSFNKIFVGQMIDELRNMFSGYFSGWKPIGASVLGGMTA